MAQTQQKLVAVLALNAPQMRSVPVASVSILLAKQQFLANL
jgi:hypothetical protein